jgi:hypothetical protein
MKFNRLEGLDGVVSVLEQCRQFVTKPDAAAADAQRSKEMQKMPEMKTNTRFFLYRAV